MSDLQNLNGSALTIDDIAFYASIFILILLTASFLFVFLQSRAEKKVKGVKRNKKS